MTPRHTSGGDARREEGLFDRILELIYEKSPLQKKRLEEYIGTRDGFFRGLAEDFARSFLAYLRAEGIPLEYAVDSYLDMCKEFLIEQLHFSKTGKYSCESSLAARSEVYENRDRMNSYMHGIIISIFLWKSHYLMFEYFIKEALSVGAIKRGLEIGAGHGLFLSQAMKKFPEAVFKVVDISPVSISIASKLTRHTTPSPERIEFVNSDIREFESGEKFDFIIMGEVLEHVEDPLGLLKRIRSLITGDGRLFLTTCANAPAVDHVYCYESVAAISGMIEEAGFRVAGELPLSAEGVPREKWEELKTPVNYAAIALPAS